MDNVPEVSLVYEGDNLVFRQGDMAIKYTLDMEDGNELRAHVEGDALKIASSAINVPEPLQYTRYYNPTILTYNNKEYRVISRLITKWIDGNTLEYMLQHKLLSKKDRIQAAQNLIIITKHLHKVGVEHGDMYPSNWMVDKKGVIYLIDFGGSTIHNSSIENEKDLFEFGPLSVTLSCLIHNTSDWDLGDKLNLFRHIDNIEHMEERMNNLLDSPLIL